REAVRSPQGQGHVQGAGGEDRQLPGCLEARRAFLGQGRQQQAGWYDGPAQGCRPQGRQGRGGQALMASQRQVTAAKRNVKKAQAGARAKKSIASMPKATRTALGKQGAAVAQRKRTGASGPKTRAELYEIAKRRELPG